MNWTKLSEDCERAVLLDQIESRAGRQRDRDRAAREQHERTAFRPLQSLLTRRVRRLVARHGGCLPLAVHVSPMINHANHTAQAWARVTWANPMGFAYSFFLANNWAGARTHNAGAQGTRKLRLYEIRTRSE